MRLRTLTAALAAAATCLLGAPAASAAPTCAGAPSVPPAYLCVVRFAVTDGDLPTVGGWTVVHVPSICVLAVCTAPVDLTVPRATLSRAEVAVLYWNGLCVYVYADGTVTTAPGGPACP